MFSSSFCDVNIKIFPIKLLLDVLFSIIKILLAIFLFHLIGYSIELRLSMTNEIQHLDRLAIITTNCSLRVSQTYRVTKNCYCYLKQEQYLEFTYH